VEALYRYGVLALEVGHEEEAEEALRRVVQLRPQWAKAHYQLSLALERKQDTAEALDEAREAVRLEPENEGYILRQGMLCNRLGFHDEAISLLEKALTLPTTPVPQTYFELGQAFEGKGEEWWLEAVNEYRRAAELAPENVRYQRSLGILLAQMMAEEPGASSDEDNGIALAALRAAVRLNPQDSEAHFYLGRICLAQGLLEEAEKHFRQARELDPADPDYAYYLAQTLYSTGRYQEASGILGGSSSDSADILFLRARCDEALGNIEAALDAYQRVSALAPTHVEAWCKQGSLLMSQERWKEATGPLKRALRLTEDQGDKSLQATLHRQLGRAWKELSQYDTALMHLQRVVALGGEDAETYYLLGSLLAEQGELAAAMGALKQAVDLNPAFAQAHFALGQLYERRGSESDSARALASYRRAARYASQEPRYLREWARMLCQQGQEEEAVPILRRVLEMAPEDVEAYRYLGKAEEALGRLEKARRAYEAAVALAPEDLALLKAKALVLRKWMEHCAQAGEPANEADYREFMDTWRRIIQIEGEESLLACRERGLVNALFGHDNEAAKDLAQALTLGGEDALLRRRRAELLLRLDRLQEALDEAKVAVGIAPREAINHHLLARCYLALGWKERAVRALEQAIKLDPSQALYYYSLSEALCQLGQVESAVATLERAIALESEQASWHHWLGQLYAYQGLYSKAVEAYGQAVELAPDNSRYHHDLGQAQAQIGHLKEAAKALERALELDPSQANWLIELGQLYEQSRCYELAHQCYHRAAELQEGDEPQQLVHLARASYLAGQEEEALQSLLQAIELANDWPPAFEALGDFHSHCGRHPEAVEAYLQAASLDPKNPRYNLKLGQALSELGEYDQAIDYLERAAILDSHGVAVYIQLGEAYQELERYDEAMQAYQQALKIAPNEAGTLLRLGCLCHQLGYLDQAQSYFESLTALQPDEATAYAHLGSICMDRGDLDGAVQNYLKAIELDPNQADYYYELGLVYKQRREYKKAGSYFRQTVKLDPNNRNAYKQFAAVSALSFLGQ